MIFASIAGRRASGTVSRTSTAVVWETSGPVGSPSQVMRASAAIRSIIVRRSAGPRSSRPDKRASAGRSRDGSWASSMSCEVIASRVSSSSWRERSTS